MHFRIQGLPAEKFAHLFIFSNEELAQAGAVRRIADGPRPCRVSLTDAEPGDELILVNYGHHAVASPYRMRFAIYVRRGKETFDAVDTVPEQLRKRMLAVRAFDRQAMMVGWELAEGRSSKVWSSACWPIRARPICMSTSLRPAAMLRAASGRDRSFAGGLAQRGVDAVLPARSVLLEKIKDVAVDAQ
jgi:hypothetical protein